MAAVKSYDRTPSVVLTHCVVRGAWGKWSPNWQLGVDIHGATAGIIGFGRIGRFGDVYILYT